jgi:Fe2+ or Zn2+ uptake regulation protein
MMEEQLYPSIEDLIAVKKISAYVGKYCESVGLKSLDDIVSYCKQGQFKDVKGVGARTYAELNMLYESIIQLSPNNVLFQTEIPDKHESDIIMERFNSLLTNDFKRTAIHEKYEQYIQTYPAVAQIWLTKIPLTVFVTEYLCYFDNKSLKVRHFYVKNLLATIDLEKKLAAEITRQFNLSEEDSLKEEFVNHYGLSCSVDFFISYYKQHGYPPMFWILEKYLENRSDREMNVLKRTFKIYQNQQPVSLTEFVAGDTVSRERIRQIRKNIFKKVLSPKSLFFDYKVNWNHYKPLDKDVIWDTDMQTYIDDEQCSFSTKFILQILLNLLYYESYTIYNGYTPIIKSEHWEHAFLVRNNCSDAFDFEKFRVDFKELMTKNKSEYLLDIKKYILKCKCWKKRKLADKKSIANIVHDIILYEFHLYPESDGRIKIPALKKKTLFDVMYEILDSNGDPMHISDVFLEFKKRLPEHHYSRPEQLRYYLIKHKEVTYQNRKSVYVLKEWKHVKSGTIRNTIIEFLSKKKLPQTAKDITDYVRLYFPETNISSVRTSMSNETKHRFVFFEGRLFGLSKKKYPSKYTFADYSLPKFAERVSDLEKFIDENGHFPFASSADRNERSLGVWWVRVTKKVNKVSESELKEIERIRAKYAGLTEQIRPFKWDMNCEKLKCFVLENHRAPDIITENLLYSWLIKAQTDFLNNKLNKVQQQKYLELMELM